MPRHPDLRRAHRRTAADGGVVDRTVRAPQRRGGPLMRPATILPAPSSSRMPGLTTQIFIGLLLAVVVGYLWPSFGGAVRPLAEAFLRMIKMIIAPLVFATLVVGIAGTGDLKSMGRIGVKAIIYFEVATTI